MAINGILLNNENIANTTLSNLTGVDSTAITKLQNIGMASSSDLTTASNKKKYVYEVSEATVGYASEGLIADEFWTDKTLYTSPTNFTWYKASTLEYNSSTGLFSIVSTTETTTGYVAEFSDDAYVIKGTDVGGLDGTFYGRLRAVSVHSDGYYDSYGCLLIMKPSETITQVSISSNSKSTINDNKYYKKVSSGSYIISGEGSATTSTFSYSVETASGASYGFPLNSSTGYYTSANKGVTNSAAVAKVTLTVTGAPVDVTISYICYGESNYDYGLISTLNNTLGTTYTVDSSNVAKTMKGESSSAEKTFTFSSVPVGTSTFYIKYRKDSSTNSGNDTLQFKCSSSSTSSSGTISPVKTTTRLNTSNSTSFSGGVTSSATGATSLSLSSGIYYVPELDTCIYSTGSSCNWMCGGDGVVFQLYDNTTYGNLELTCIRIGDI